MTRPLKVIIASSKEHFNRVSPQVIQQCDFVAYRDGFFYTVAKDRTAFMIGYPSKMMTLAQIEQRLNKAEDEAWEREYKDHMMVEEYRKHPFITLSKSENMHDEVI